MMKTVRVELARRSYDIHIGPGLLDSLGQTVTSLGGIRQVVVISDTHVAGLYGQDVEERLKNAKLQTALLTFPAGEDHKTLPTVERIFDKLFGIRPAIDRNCLVLALGGGVVGDLAGFVAATALRGLRWLPCPTTLLADVDASVGGKTAVDHAAGKNLIGAFHQPCGVIIDVKTLTTLDIRELRSGLAECVKHALIRDATLLDFLEAHAEALLDCEPETMTELIARNVTIKAAVVTDDELESGARAHLNFGHTFGHAMETYLGYGRISHGEAIALGMLCACALATHRGLVETALQDRLESLLKRLGLETRCPGLDAGKIEAIMQHDKKVRDGKVRFILPTDWGQVDIFEDVSAREAQEALAVLE